MRILSKNLLTIAFLFLVDSAETRQHNSHTKHTEQQQQQDHHQQQHQHDDPEPRKGNDQDENNIVEYDDGHHLAVRSMFIKYGHEIDSITVTYHDKDGSLVTGPRRGGTRGGRNMTIALQDDEGIVAIAGTPHKKSHKGLQELSFHTDQGNTYSVVSGGQFGKNYGEPFTHRAPKGQILGGIKGMSGKYLNTIGANWVAKDVDHMDMVDVPGSLFFIKKKVLSWSEHVKEAQRLGYRLASINHKDQETRIVTGLNDPTEFSTTTTTTPGFWIGGKRVKGMVFEWLDNRRAQYTHWHRFEPSNTKGQQNCIEIKHQDDKWAWNDEDCTIGKYALYEVVSTSTSSEKPDIAKIA